MNNTTKPITIIRQKKLQKNNENNNNKCNFGDMHKIQTVGAAEYTKKGPP